MLLDEAVSSREVFVIIPESNEQEMAVWKRRDLDHGYQLELIVVEL